MNKIKYAIPLLALILLIPVGMSNVFAQSEPGEEDSTDEIGPVANVYDPYLEVLKQHDFYQNMTSDEQEEYVQAINEFKAEQNPYQSTVQELIDIGSQLTLNLQQAKADDDAEKIQNLEAELFALMETLKIYGVVTSEELDKNPNYWAQQAKNASDVINNNSVSSVCFELGSDLNCGGQAEMYASLITDGIMPIHTSDISLENKAYIWFQSQKLLVMLFISLLGILSLVLVLYRRRLKTFHIQTE